jgi:hypothetical protein
VRAYKQLVVAYTEYVGHKWLGDYMLIFTREYGSKLAMVWLPMLDMFMGQFSIVTAIALCARVGESLQATNGWVMLNMLVLNSLEHRLYVDLCQRVWYGLVANAKHVYGTGEEVRAYKQLVKLITLILDGLEIWNIFYMLNCLL